MTAGLGFVGRGVLLSVPADHRLLLQDQAEDFGFEPPPSWFQLSCLCWFGLPAILLVFCCFVFCCKFPHVLYFRWADGLRICHPAHFPAAGLDWILYHLLGRTDLTSPLGCLAHTFICVVLRVL